MLTCQCALFQRNLAGIEFMIQRTWLPGQNPQVSIAGIFGIQPGAQLRRAEEIPHESRRMQLPAVSGAVRGERPDHDT
jgi:hypothetical protein